MFDCTVCIVSRSVSACQPWQCGKRSVSFSGAGDMLEGSAQLQRTPFSRLVACLVRVCLDLISGEVPWPACDVRGGWRALVYAGGVVGTPAQGASGPEDREEPPPG
jgi:hypothetical protein